MRLVVNTRFRSVLCSLGLALSLAVVPGCGRPSQDDCSKAVDHLMDLITSAAPPESDDVKKALANQYSTKRDEFLASCKEQGTKKDVDCIMASKTLDDLSKNCGQAATGK